MDDRIMALLLLAAFTVGTLGCFYQIYNDQRKRRAIESGAMKRDGVELLSGFKRRRAIGGVAVGLIASVVLLYVNVKIGSISIFFQS